MMQMAQATRSKNGFNMIAVMNSTMDQGSRPCNASHTTGPNASPARPDTAQETSMHHLSTRSPNDVFMPPTVPEPGGSVQPDRPPSLEGGGGV